MTAVEFDAWVQYRSKRGPLDVQTRVEYTAAMLATVVAAQKGSKATVRDFLMWEPEKETSIEEVAKLLGATVDDNGR